MDNSTVIVKNFNSLLSMMVQATKEMNKYVQDLDNATTE